ncbi:MAG: lactonase family protein [Gemmatimonadaceae bacterium]
MRPNRFIPVLATLAACSTTDDATGRLPLAPLTEVAAAAAVGQVYTASNSPAGNAILAFDRAADGSLTPAGSYATGGTGTGAGLGNQGGLIIAGNGRYLLAVNAASHDVTSFLIRPNGSLERVGTWGSGGTQPISLTESGRIVYVLNAGGSGGITGFTFVGGRLSMIAGSTRPLSTAAAGAAQVEFAASGRVLIVTEKATNSISTYTVDAGGMATGPTVFASNGQTPFGFGVSRGTLVVSEAFGGAPDASAVSSYEIGRTGSLRLVSGSVGTTETAACWIVITGDGRFAYTTNTGSGSISGYALTGATLTLLDADGVTATTDAGPIDLAFSRNSQFVYSLNSFANTVTGFAVGAGGDLTPVAAGAGGLPAGANGLAAR